jgi:hypothetical protein
MGSALTFQISVLHGTNLLQFIEVIKLCTSAIYFTNSAAITLSVACFHFRVTGIPFWDMTLRHWVISFRRCEGMLCLYPEGARVVIYEGGIFLCTLENQNPVMRLHIPEE